MDYEQDYSKLTPVDNHWYNRPPGHTPMSEEEHSSTVVVTLDNEDFD